MEGRFLSLACSTGITSNLALSLSSTSCMQYCLRSSLAFGDFDVRTWVNRSIRVAFDEANINHVIDLLLVLLEDLLLSLELGVLLLEFLKKLELLLHSHFLGKSCGFFVDDLLLRSSALGGHLHTKEGEIEH